MPKDAALFASPQSHADADELLAFIRRLQRDDPLRPVTVVCPHAYAMQSLRHTLGRAGFANVQFKEFAMLAEFLGAPALAAENRRPLTAIYRSAVVRAVAAQATGLLQPQRDHPSTHMSLRQTFMQLRHASELALNNIEARGGLRAESVALYRRFRELTQAFYDDADLAEAAANAVRNAAAAGLDDLGFIVFFRVRGLTRPQSDLMRALAETQRCAVLLGETGDAEADASIQEMIAELRPHLGEPQPAPQIPQADADAITETAQSNAHASVETAHLLVAPTAHEEVRWVIRQIVHRAQTRATPFHRIAVLYRKQSPYAALIRDELALAGIPVAGADATPLADTAVGRTLNGILRLWDEDFARDAVMEWLTGCPLKPPEGIDAVAFSPSRWDAVSKRAGIVRGAAQWRQRLEQFAANAEQRAEYGIAQDEISPAAEAAMRFEAYTARQIERFITDLAQNAAPPADVGGEPWRAYSEWALNLLDRCLADALPEEEQRAREKIQSILNELKQADEIQPDASYDAFKDIFKLALNEALQVPAGRGGAVGQGVFAAPLNRAAAMTFDVVHIVGMIEGAVPPAMRDDPLISERDREQAGGAEQGLTLQRQRKADERHAFLAALAAAPQCTLSYPLADTAGQRRNYASRWLLEKASQLAGRQVFDSDLTKLSAESWLTVISSLPNSLATAQSAAHADKHDYNLERLLRWQRLGIDAAQHPFMADAALAASVRLGRARNGSAFTAWDGNLAAEAPNAAFARRLGEQPMSPTRLERWARCPFSYFLSSVLRLGAEDNPEDIHTISPLERGALLHGILEEFIDAMRKRNALPAPNEAWKAEQRAELHRIADKAFSAAAERGIVGKSVMWQIVKEDMRVDLDVLLDEDLRMRERHGVSPLAVEVHFGIGKDGWREAEYALADEAETTIKFRGKIDRIDVSPDGSEALVLDYKAGSRSAYGALNKDPIDRGKRLQLAIYSLAARQGLRNAQSVSAAYWFVTAKGNFALAPSTPVRINDENVQKHFSEGVSIILDGIRGGIFPANPGPPSWGSFQNCNYCDFDSLCPSERNVIWERKSADPLLKDYTRLADGDYAAEED